MMKVIENLIRVRGSLTQKEFASRIGTNQSTVQKWEKGETLPGSRFLEAIYREFGVSVDWLLTGQGDPYIKDRARGSPGPSESEKPVVQVSGAENVSDENFRISDALTMCARVLDSQTSYATALYLNIQHFDRAVSAERRLAQIEHSQKSMENKINALVEKVKTLEYLQEEKKELRKEVNRLRATYESPGPAPDTEEEAM